MKTRSILLILAALALGLVSCKQEPVTGWAPAGDNIKTRWAAEVSPANVHPEYPRPQMVRSDWKSLNGLWDYAITPIAATAMPEADGQILVPFSVESALSGVGRTVTPDDALWYSTSFEIPRAWKGKRVLLHFDGVDWKAEASINGIPLETHTGAYTAFEYDITPYLENGGQKLVLKVSDATDITEFQPHGKQVLHPSGIWYTAVTGIWKSVWLEPVAESRIVDYDVVSDIDNASLSVSVATDALRGGDQVRVELLDGAVGYSTEKPSRKVLASGEAAGSKNVEVKLSVPDMQLWSPDSPYLYGLRLSIVRNGKVVDKVDAYTAMRKISKERDAEGHLRLALNNEFLFQYGPLDQGWWPDGLYTPPTDEAMRYDIEQTKAHGFNMIRKHIKVEPFTWFYACDQLGVLVWQDMPSFTDNRSSHWKTRAYATREDDSKVTDEAKANYYKEWSEIMAQLKKFQSIVVWVPFNEAWSQFDTPEVVDFTYAQDRTRLVNMASGGNWFEGVGDILDSHNYPHPALRITDPDMVNVLGEYGGIGFPVEGHLWQKDKNWGYVQYKSGSEVTDAYVEYAAMLEDLVREGCSAAVYTQTTDVEIEVNGLMTYDREVVKMDVERVAAANQKVIDCMSEFAVAENKARELGGEYTNFVLDTKVLAEKGASASVFFHTDGKGGGYEVLLHNGPIDGTRKTGSLASVRNLYRSLAEDGEWFDLELAVRGKNISVKVNGTEVVCYTEPAIPYRTAKHNRQLLGKGGIRIAGAEGIVHFKDLHVKALPADATNPDAKMPPVDEQNDAIIRLQQQDFPVIDYHVHLKGDLTKEMAHAMSMNYGINYGVAPNAGEGGVGRMLANDEEVYAYLDEVKDMPFLRGVQGEGRKWTATFSQEALGAFDYLFTDAMTIIDHKGRNSRIYRAEEVHYDDIDKEGYMEQIVNQSVLILTNEPADIFANPTYIPEDMQADYDKYWTPARVDRVLDVLQKYQIALEINPRYKIPSLDIIRKAKSRGIKFTFGTNNVDSNFGRLEYCVEAIEKCGITADDMWFPSMSIRRTRPVVIYNHFK